MAERDENGKFLPGHKVNQGRKNPNAGRTAEEYKRIIASVVSFADWRLIILKAMEQAQNGDDKARKFLSDYLAGSPQQFLDITSAGEKLFETPMDEMNDAQRKEYAYRLATRLLGNEGSADLADTASEKE